METNKGSNVQYYRDCFGNVACLIVKANNTARLICKDRAGKIWKDKPYESLKGAKTALGMAGPWIEVSVRGTTQSA